MSDNVKHGDVVQCILEGTVHVDVVGDTVYRWIYVTDRDGIRVAFRPHCFKEIKKIGENLNA